MKKRVLPWSLKGVSRAARDAAKDAAAREGVPLGVWLSRVIRETNMAERADAATLELDESKPNSIERVVARLGGTPGSQTS